MGDKFVATVRFHTEGVEAKLYQRLLEGKEEAGLSLPDYIKQILAGYFAGEDRQRERDGLAEQFHGECMELMAGMETLLHRCMEGHHTAVMEALAGRQLSDGGTHWEENAAKLPEESGGIPEGALDFLDRLQ